MPISLSSRRFFFQTRVTFLPSADADAAAATPVPPEMARHDAAMMATPVPIRCRFFADTPSRLCRLFSLCCCLMPSRAAAMTPPPPADASARAEASHRMRFLHVSRLLAGSRQPRHDCSQVSHIGQSGLYAVTPPVIASGHIL